MIIHFASTVRTENLVEASFPHVFLKNDCFFTEPMEVSDIIEEPDVVLSQQDKNYSYQIGYSTEFSEIDEMIEEPDIARYISQQDGSHFYQEGRCNYKISLQ